MGASLAHPPVPLEHLSQALFLILPSQSGSRLTYGGDGLAEGHEAKAVLEDTSAVEDREGDAHDLLEPVLDPAQPGTRGVLNLVEQVVLPKGEDWHESCPRGTQGKTFERTQKSKDGKQRLCG